MAEQVPTTQPCAAPCDLGSITSKTAVRIVVIGDFGYEGEGSGHVGVRDAIAARHSRTPYDLGITVGDNFYPSGVKNVAELEKRWAEFAKLNIPFYATLGNHDYRGNEQAQVDFTAKSSTWKMPERYYTFAAGPVRFLALDTDEGTLAWWRKLFPKAWSASQASWLTDRLAATTDAGWRIAYGHHPIRSNGEHGDEGRLKRGKPFATLLSTAGVIYIAGHDHDLEYIEEEGQHFFIVGGGGKDVRRLDAGAAFSCSGHGFLELDATPDALTFEFVGKDGTSLYKRVVRKPGVADQPGDRSAAPVTCK